MQIKIYNKDMLSKSLKVRNTTFFPGSLRRGLLAI